MIPSCFLYQITDGGKKEKGFSQRESLEIAKQAGIKNMDINAAMFDSVPVENVKALLDEFGMTMCVHSARICDFSSEEGYNKQQVGHPHGYFGRYVAHASILLAFLVVYHFS